MFANRLGKNLKRLGKMAQRARCRQCYRLYDADMPEYAFAIDHYLEADGGALHLYVQEYARARGASSPQRAAPATARHCPRCRA